MRHARLDSSKRLLYLAPRQLVACETNDAELDDSNREADEALGPTEALRSLSFEDFASGGPGGAVFLDDSAQDIIYAAAAKSASGVTTRYLMRDRVQWRNQSPFVDTASHEPLGY